MDLDIKIIRNHQVIAKKINDEFLVLNANKGSLYKLNPTAQAIWRCTRVQKSIKEVVKEVMLNFSVDQDTAEKEVRQFIKQHVNHLFFVVK